MQIHGQLGQQKVNSTSGFQRFSLSAFQLLSSPLPSPQLPMALDSSVLSVRITPTNSRQSAAERQLSGPVGSYRELWGVKSHFPTASGQLGQQKVNKSPSVTLTPTVPTLDT